MDEVKKVESCGSCGQFGTINKYGVCSHCGANQMLVEALQAFKKVESPVPKGDGITDDTKAVQHMIDKGVFPHVYNKPESPDLPKEQFSPERAEQVRALIASIRVNEANLLHIAESKKINGSLHASLYEIFYRYEKELADLRSDSEVKDKLIEDTGKANLEMAKQIDDLRAERETLNDKLTALEMADRIIIRDLSERLGKAEAERDKLKEELAETRKKWLEECNRVCDHCGC